MKFGNTLYQRSVPQWANYNVDYDDIKHRIKVCTSKSQGQPQTVPGAENEARAFRDLEEELLGELKEQHQRVDLFVQSKSGEISRRLTHLEKRIEQLNTKACLSSHSSHKRPPFRHLDKYSRLAEETSKTGDDVQSLPRFVGANRLALQKLLKKYKKWTGCSGLGDRFCRNVLDGPASFSNKDFEPLLARYIDVLTKVRIPFRVGPDWPFESPKQHRAPQTSAAHLHSINGDWLDVEFDLAFATVPLAHGSAHATYWVHPDNVVPIQVILSQYTQPWESIKISSSPGALSSSVRSTPRGSISDITSTSAVRNETDIGIVICDSVARFAAWQGSKHMSSSKDVRESTAEEAVASIRYSSANEAVVAVNLAAKGLDKTPAANTGQRHHARFKRKTARQLFDKSYLTNGADALRSDSSKQICQWITNHPEVQPLVQLQCKRKRFIGLQNTGKGGIWATLDQDVSMIDCSLGLQACDKTYLSIDKEGDAQSIKFPHAILEVRIEGDCAIDLIAALDDCHLTKRVPGFSLEVHAVSSICKPRGMPQPYWLSIVRSDICQIAAPSAPLNGRLIRNNTSQEQSTGRTSISADSTINRQSSSGFSTRPGESSATSAPDVLDSPPPITPLKNRKQSKRRLPQRRQLKQSVKIGDQRYWNEFDDGSEGEQDEPYTIIIHPNESSSLIGAAAVSSLLASFTAKVEASREKVNAWFKSSQKKDSIPNEQEPLIGDNYISIIEDSSDSDDEMIRSPRHILSQRLYSTFSPKTQSPAVRARESLLFRSCIASFAASFLLLLIAGMLVETGRRKAARTVDVGVIIGVVSSLVFAVISVGSMVGMQSNIGWMHRSIVVVTFAIVVLGNAGLLFALERG